MMLVKLTIGCVWKAKVFHLKDFVLIDVAVNCFQVTVHCFLLCQGFRVLEPLTSAKFLGKTHHETPC